MIDRFVRYSLITVSGLFLLSCRERERTAASNERPNILFVIADDQSFPHASAYGKQVFKTPAFDEVARRGVLFTNAFVVAPQCSPSRAAILTGRHIWQLEEAGTHSSYFPKKFPVFTAVLEASGYAVGYTGKAWGPGNWEDAGWQQNPVGKEYNTIKFESLPYQGLSKIDYAANFKLFLEERTGDKPFFFWFGSQEPHRNYEYGSGVRSSLSASDVELPAFLPVDDSVVNDMLDYAQEISWFDQQLASMLAMLKERGELGNTLIVVTADNGMPFPHAKANLQEYGIHVPLAICGPGMNGNRRVDDLVSLIDLAPTFLEISGSAPMEGVMGKSLLPLLREEDSGEVDTTRRYILSGRERHTHARPDNAGYPARAMRTDRYLYIRNFRPERWPVGDPPPLTIGNRWEDPDMKSILHGFEDIDDSPSKRVMLRGAKKWPRHYQIVFEKRGEEELYDIGTDPFCMKDLSSDPAHASALANLRNELESALRETGDPRVLGTGDIFDTYPRFGRMRPFDGFRKRGEYNRSGGRR